MTTNGPLTPIILNTEISGLQTTQRRVRIEVSTSTKGVHTYSCTVEILDEHGVMLNITDDVLAESDRLVKLLDARYPAVTT